MVPLQYDLPPTSSGLFVLPNTTFTLSDSAGGGALEMQTASVAGTEELAAAAAVSGAGGGLFVQGTATINVDFFTLTSCAAVGGQGGNAGSLTQGGGGGGGMWQRYRKSGGTGNGGGGGGGGFGMFAFGGPHLTSEEAAEEVEWECWVWEDRRCTQRAAAAALV